MNIVSAGKQTRGLIHVGMPKTMTTTLQKVVFPNLSKRKYIDIDSLNDFFLLLSQKQNEQTFLSKAKQYDFEKIFSMLNDGALISREHFLINGWHDGRDYSLQNLEYLQKHHNFDFDILLVLRRQDEWLKSAYKYKAEVFEDVKDLFGDGRFGAKGSRHFSVYDRKHLDYRALHAHLKNRFPKAHIHLALFEDIKAGHRSGLENALDEILDPAHFSNENKKNVSALQRRQYSKNRFIAALQRRFFKEKLPLVDITFDEGYLKDFLAFYADSNRELAETHNLSMQKHGYF